MLRSSLTLAVLLASIAITHASGDGIHFPSDGRKVLVPGHGLYLLGQCSRNTPADIVSFWLPSSGEIDTLERRLPDYFAKSEKPPDGEYARTYVGIVTKGSKLIYGNFYPRSGPEMICDGGPQFWGIVFNPTTNEFSDLEFNGVA